MSHHFIPPLLHLGVSCAPLRPSTATRLLRFFKGLNGLLSFSSVVCPSYVARMMRDVDGAYDRDFFCSCLFRLSYVSMNPFKNSPGGLCSRPCRRPSNVLVRLVTYDGRDLPMQQYVDKATPTVNNVTIVTSNTFTVAFTVLNSSAI